MIDGTVAIVGRPNVGKSTVFNRMLEQRLSIVEDTPGVTRDRIYGDCQWLSKTYRLIDTGGIQIEDVPFQKETGHAAQSVPRDPRRRLCPPQSQSSQGGFCGPAALF